MVEKAKDIVERLRKEAKGVTVNLNPWPTMREAADEIERLRAEIVRLEAMKQEPEAAAQRPSLRAVEYSAGCAGRAPDPVATVNPSDNMMTCYQIESEIAANNQRIQDLAREHGWKVAQNVAAGVAGIVICLG
jgi:hypothetical protein